MTVSEPDHDGVIHRPISALTIVVGWKAQIALRDVRGLDPKNEEEIVTWAARVLVQAAIKEDAAEAEHPKSG